jgi:hypothetical protein
LTNVEDSGFWMNPLLRLCSTSLQTLCRPVAKYFLTIAEAERAAVAERARIAHAERVAAAQQTFGPPSIGGWVPPTVLSAKLGSVAKDTEESSSDRDENGGALSLPAVEAIKQEAFVKQESPVKEENGNTLPECSDDSSHSGSSDTDTSCEDGGVPRQRPISFF